MDFSREQWKYDNLTPEDVCSYVDEDEEMCQGCGNEVSTTDKRTFAEKLCVDCETKKYEIHN